MSDEVITDAHRYPGLTEHGRQMLEFLREHPCAPVFRNQSGHRLLPEEVQQLREIDHTLRTAPIGWRMGNTPGWINDFISECCANVPHYRKYGLEGAVDIRDVPTIDRGDLSHDIAAFVPDNIPIDRLINYSSSGTTGRPLLLASHPTVAARYLIYHKRAFQRFGVELQARRGQVGIVLVGFQRGCFTYTSVTPLMDESGLVKLNIHPGDWHHPDDQVRYLDALNPELYSGDPLSFAELMRLPLKTRPRALLSTAMSLSPAFRDELTRHFGCPVIDVYSMNESGPIAVFDPAAGGHVLLQERLYVEILDRNGHQVPPGERGEITITGGFNFCLPLLRYRTGDYASMGQYDSVDPLLTAPVLYNLEGRPPVTFRTMSGAPLNNIEVTHVLKSFALPQYTLHQFADQTLRLRASPANTDARSLRQALESLFGQGQPIDIELGAIFEGKVVQYTSDMPNR